MAISFGDRPTLNTINGCSWATMFLLALQKHSLSYKLNIRGMKVLESYLVITIVAISLPT